MITHEVFFGAESVDTNGPIDETAQGQFTNLVRNLGLETDDVLSGSFDLPGGFREVAVVESAEYEIGGYTITPEHIRASLTREGDASHLEERFSLTVEHPPETQNGNTIIRKETFTVTTAPFEQKGPAYEQQDKVLDPQGNVIPTRVRTLFDRADTAFKEGDLALATDLHLERQAHVREAHQLSSRTGENVFSHARLTGLTTLLTDLKLIPAVQVPPPLSSV